MTVSVSGRVVRISGQQVAAELERQVPLETILDEELWLSRSFDSPD